MFRSKTNRNKFIYNKTIPQKNTILSKSFHQSGNKLESYPIKPSNNIIPKDINLQKIFLKMKKNSQDFSRLYSNLLINYNPKIIQREEILTEIKNYFLYNHIEYKIFFKTIFLYDILLIQNEIKKLLTSFEEIALGALILSLKFNYLENKMFSLKSFAKFYEYKNYSLHQILDIERKCLETIDYYLNYITPMCFLEFFLINGIIYNTDSLTPKDYYKIYSEVETSLEKIMEKSNNYLKYNFFYIACSVIANCRVKFGLEQWPSSLIRVFGVDFNQFENEYKYFFTNIEKIINNHESKDIIINGNNNIFLLNFKDKIKGDEINSFITNFNLYKKSSGKIINNTKNIINIHYNDFSLNNIYNSINYHNDQNIEEKNENLNKKNYNKTLDSYNNKNYSNLCEFSYQNSIIIENEKNNILENYNKLNDIINKNLTKNSLEIKDNKYKFDGPKSFSQKIFKKDNIENNNNKKEEKKKEEEKQYYNKSNKTINIEIYNENNKTNKTKNYNFSSRFKITNNNTQNYDKNNLLNFNNKKYDKKSRITNNNIEKNKIIFNKKNNNNNNNTNSKKKIFEANYDLKALNNSKYNKIYYNDCEKYNTLEKYTEKNYNNLIENERIEKQIIPYQIKNNENDKNNNKNILKKFLSQEKTIENNRYEKPKTINTIKDNKKNFSIRNNTNKVLNNKFETPMKKGKKKIMFKTLEKEKNKNINKNKNKDKDRYINLIKYKLSISSSLNKNK